MKERFSRRVRRLVHSMTEPSAPRMIRFLVADHTHAATQTDLVSSPSPPPPSYSEDLDVLDALSTKAGTPPVIFQTWKSRTDIPLNYQYWRKTFVERNPGARAVLWDDKDNIDFVRDRFDWFLPTYESYPREIFRADAVRFFFLFEFGGLYADMDSECLRPIADTAGAGSVVLCRMGGDPGFEHSIPNAVMASAPGQLFWLFAIARMIDVAERNKEDAQRNALGPELMTGPVLLKRTYDEFSAMGEVEARAAVAHLVVKLSPAQRAKINYAQPTLLPSAAWYPLDWTNLFHKALCNRLRAQRRILPSQVSLQLFPKSAIVTYWSHSW